MEMETDETQGTIDLRDGVQQLEWELASDTMNQRKKEKRQLPPPEPEPAKVEWIARDFQRQGGFDPLTAPERAAYLADLGFTVALQVFPPTPDWDDVAAFLDVVNAAGMKGTIGFISGVTQFTPSLNADGTIDLGPIGELLTRHGASGDVAFVSLTDEPGGHGMNPDTLAKAHTEAKRIAANVPTWVGMSGEIQNGRWLYSLGQSDLVLIQHLLAKYDQNKQPTWNWPRFTAVQTVSRQRIAAVNPKQPITAGIQVKGVRQAFAEAGLLRPVTAAELRQLLEYVFSPEVEAILPTTAVWIQGTDGEDESGRTFGLSSPDAAEHRAIVKEFTAAH